MKRYIIQDRATGTMIDEFDSMKAAEKTLELYEKEDKKDGIFEPDFYEIVTEE